jgi:translation initiation factor IF-1
MINQRLDDFSRKKLKKKTQKNVENLMENNKIKVKTQNNHHRSAESKEH